MPRRARILLPGVPVHLIQRGNNRSACFYAEEDCRIYLDQPRRRHFSERNPVTSSLGERFARGAPATGAADGQAS
jgi:putative transposase